MSKYLQNIIREELLNALKEEEIPTSPFTDAEEKFLAKFVELGTQSLGILYTKNEVGIREFLMRSGKDYNLTPDVLSKLMKDGIISIVPYGGYARNEDYTIKCNLPLDELEGLSSGDSEEGDDTSTPPADDAGDTPEPDTAPLDDTGEPQESASSSTDLSKLLVSEQKRHTSTRVYTNKSRALRRLPKGYVVYLEKIIKILGQKLHTDLEKQHLVADILDNLAHNFGLTPKQVYKSFIFYNSQNRLKNIVREQLENDEDMIKLKELLNLNEQSSDSIKWYKSLPKTNPNINYGDAYNYMLKYAGKQGSKNNPISINTLRKLSDQELISFFDDFNAFLTTLPPEIKNELGKKRFIKVSVGRKGTFKIETPAPEPVITETEIGPIQLGMSNGKVELFPDDSATLTSDAIGLINRMVKQQVEEARANPILKDAYDIEIAPRVLNFSAGTSKVRSKYNSTTYSAANNIPLCKDRLAAMQKAFVEALKANGVVGIEDCIQAGGKHYVITEKPNEGPEWGEQQRKDTKTYGKQGARTKAYQNEYEKYRFASGQVALSLSYTVNEIDPGKPKIDSGESYEWMFKVQRRSSGGGGGGRKKKCFIFCKGLGLRGNGLFSTTASVSCPRFTKKTGKKSRLNPGIKTPMGRM